MANEQNRKIKNKLERKTTILNCKALPCDIVDETSVSHTPELFV